MADALRSFSNLRQKEGETLIDFAQRSKSSKSVLKAQLGGPIRLSKYVTEYKVKDNILYQDNQSAIKLKINGRKALENGLAT